MLTPSGGIVRSSRPEHTCHECRRELTNVTRYPGPVQFRCVNRGCGQCCLPAVAQPARRWS